LIAHITHNKPPIVKGSMMLFSLPVTRPPAGRFIIYLKASKAAFDTFIASTKELISEHSKRTRRTPQSPNRKTVTV